MLRALSTRRSIASQVLNQSYLEKVHRELGRMLYPAQWQRQKYQRLGPVPDLETASVSFQVPVASGSPPPHLTIPELSPKSLHYTLRQRQARQRRRSPIRA